MRASNDSIHRLAARMNERLDSLWSEEKFGGALFIPVVSAELTVTLLFVLSFLRSLLTFSISSAVQEVYSEIETLTKRDLRWVSCFCVCVCVCVCQRWRVGLICQPCSSSCVTDGNFTCNRKMYFVLFSRNMPRKSFISEGRSSTLKKNKKRWRCFESLEIFGFYLHRTWPDFMMKSLLYTYLPISIIIISI